MGMKDQCVECKGVPRPGDYGALEEVATNFGEVLWAKLCLPQYDCIWGCFFKEEIKIK